MDISSIIGLSLAVLALVVAILMEGINLSGMLNLPALVIILGGTIGATMFSFPMREIQRVPALLVKAFTRDKTNLDELIDNLVRLAEIARREGLLALESHANQEENPLLRNGLGFAIDGIDPEEIRRIMENEIIQRQRQAKQAAAIFETAGGYAPTMGIIGTVVGLVHVLSNISDVNQLAASIAVAFLATFYGIATANILWLPIAAKLKAKAAEELVANQIILDGILGIVQGKNPRLIRRELEILKLQEKPSPERRREE
ncbi:MAG: flagellar motor protein [Thermanaeromonas sp.]|uniref:flagellar motor protein n=1 Tax=Thermanaeromonas sp. TaxID=2003697 RepID=UPI002437FDFF|nr:flagellar motor protein [Thermanaeromonas sp.]MCG0277469.1 flagellar motor protein [Thermanaeromonas sp.]